MVIQRIQSVYLLIVAILMAVYSFMNVVLVQSATEPVMILTLFSASIISFILSMLVACLSFYTIFKYKKLNLQIALSVSCLLLLIAQIAVLFVEILSKNYVLVEYFVCNCIPLISMIFLSLNVGQT